MVLPSKPDSSYASNRMTRSNFQGSSLLSTFRKENEPGTDDEPVSSDDNEDAKAELEEASGDEKRPRQYGVSLEEKLADSSQDKGRRPRSSRRKSESPDPASMDNSRKRASKDMAKDITDENEEDGFYFSSYRSSQSYKKRKPVDYQSRFHRKSDQYRKAPSSSMASVRTDSSPSSSPREPKSKSSSQKSPMKAKNKTSEEKGGFKVPMDIDITSPPSKVKSGFKMPPLFPNDMISSSSGLTSSTRDLPDIDDPPLSSPLTSMSETFLDEMEDPFLSSEDDVADAPSKQSLCPWCKQPVDPEALMRFQAQPKQRIREQRRFCESHKTTSAQKEWQEKGFPTINWDKFDERIQIHFEDLDKILVPESSSYYRNILDSTLKSGQAKNFRLTLDGDGLETISCGYYGTRGAAKMLDAVTERFSRKLRRLAASDHIVKTAGVVAYAQQVLVPELAVRLVKEDMGVNDETARQILRDSIELGEKLNFALNDVVPIPEELNDAETNINE